MEVWGDEIFPEGVGVKRKNGPAGGGGGGSTIQDGGIENPIYYLAFRSKITPAPCHPPPHLASAPILYRSTIQDGGIENPIYYLAFRSKITPALQAKRREIHEKNIHPRHQNSLQADGNLSIYPFYFGPLSRGKKGFIKGEAILGDPGVDSWVTRKSRRPSLMLHNLLRRADETPQGRNSCPRLQFLASVWTLSCRCPVKFFAKYQPCIIVY